MLPGGSAHVELRFANTGVMDVPAHRPTLALSDGLVDPRVHYEFLAASDDRCGAWVATPPVGPSQTIGYALNIGPLDAGSVLVCRWGVRRAATGGDDLVLLVPGLVGERVHIGTITDVASTMEQVAPMFAGASTAVEFRLTVRNPGAVDLVSSPVLGLCSESVLGSGPFFRPGGPSPCNVAELTCFGAGTGITAGLVAAGQQRDCSFVMVWSRPLLNVGRFPIVVHGNTRRFDSVFGQIHDPNWTNNPILTDVTVSAIEVDLFGASVHPALLAFWLSVLFAAMLTLRGLDPP